MKRDINKLRRWCIRRKLEGWKVAKICSYARIHRATFYVWWNKYQRHSWIGLRTKSRRPYTIHRTPSSVVKQIIRIREQYNWGPNKIEAWLKRNDSPVSHTTIHKILCGHGMNNPIDRPRKKGGHTA